MVSRRPQTDPSSIDRLGLVPCGDVNIDGDKTETVFTVHASMSADKEGVAVAQYNSRDPGIVLHARRVAREDTYPTSNGIPLGNAGSKGCKCNIKFDHRYRTVSPPFFPTTGAYEILAWYE